MVTSTTFPSDGRITSLSTFVGPMTGQEVFMIVSPPNPALAVNYQLSATTLANLIASTVINNYPAEAANSFFAGPPSIGSAAATPTFRAQVLADLPQGTTGLPLVGNGVGSATTYQVLGLIGGGIGTTALATNAILLGQGTNPVGATALLSVPLGGTGTSTLLSNAVLLGQGAGPVSATALISVPLGGIGTTALATNAVLLGEGTGPLAGAAATTAGYPLISNGSNSAPSFQAQPLGTAFVSGVLNVISGGVGTTTLAANQVVVGNGANAVSALATTINIAGKTTALGSSYLPARGFTSLGNASVSGISTTLMYGFGASLTPAASGNVLAMFNAGGVALTTTTGANTFFWQVHYGTGTAPNRGANQTGTAVNPLLSPVFLSTTEVYPGSIITYVTGLTLGTAYWFDVAASLGSNSQTAILNNSAFTLVEL